MKKILVIIPLLLLVCGCGANRKLTCTKEEAYDDIPTKMTFVSKFKKGKAVSSTGEAIMTFESEEEAKAYMDSYGGETEQVSLNGNKLTITTKQTFEKDDEPRTRNEMKLYFEGSGFKCK